MKKLRLGVKRRLRELREFAKLANMLRQHRDRKTLERRLVECLNEAPRAGARKVD